MTSSAADIYDLRGLKCPLPVLKSRKKLATMARGDDLWVATTDQLAVIDIPHMCREEGHILIAVVPTGLGHRFHIRKG
ncbi:response regulator SirA [Agrobacterium tumefaciens]|uniref:Response regulator SirA n=1 Tax=Agrobacterium tumefaciens TaxID=358 RepID=A0A0D0KVZ7_AGRTU|nr:response regulator SirA [Agrobacterium tumefaciens]